MATLLAVLILAALTSAAPAGAQAALPVWRVALSLRCNSPSFCAELGGVSGREVFYADDTADAELTQSGRSLDTRPAAGAQHISAEAYGWFIAPSSQNPTVDDFWISSEVATFTGRQGGPPVVLTNPFPPYPEDTGVPAAPGHYGTNRFLGFSPPPGVAFQIEVVELTAS